MNIEKELKNIEKTRVFQFICAMILNTSQHRQHTVRKITVNHVKTLKKMNTELFDHAKLYDNRSVVKSRKAIAYEILQEYLHDNSVHGTKYFGNLRFKSGIVGKLFWTLIMIGSFICK